MSDLAAKICVPCRGGVPPLKGEDLAALETQVDGWNVIEGHHITKTFKFPDFREEINGLTESDFILAAKIDQLYKP